MKTVTVRIPVAINSSGEWVTTYASDKMKAEELLENTLTDASDCLMGETQHHFITAEVPIPEPVEVEGKVG